MNIDELERGDMRERLATAERLNEVNNRIIAGLLSTIGSMSTVDDSYDDDSEKAPSPPAAAGEPD